MCVHALVFLHVGSTRHAYMKVATRVSSGRSGHTESACCFYPQVTRGNKNDADDRHPKEVRGPLPSGELDAVADATLRQHASQGRRQSQREGQADKTHDGEGDSRRRGQGNQKGGRVAGQGGQDSQTSGQDRRSWVSKPLVTLGEWRCWSPRTGEVAVVFPNGRE